MNSARTDTITDTGTVIMGITVGMGTIPTAPILTGTMGAVIRNVGRLPGGDIIWSGRL
ncbi:hypothetical protein [Desulfobacter curvatus]|uniref:hypothetical protein n=1 Tax=Desulfobacter curvatus TaxID=2290 RepID=UPI0003684D93|nr:hypothetical protein [Desulfobacter curvatus]